MNTIFYSKGNVELAYELKKACRNINANVFNIRQFTELIFTVNEINPSILFLDYDFMEIPEAVLDYVTNFKFNNPISVVFITNNELADVDFEGSNFYKISPSNLQAELYNIEAKLKYTSAMKRGVNINPSQISEEITEYLISNGFSTQHKGFGFIKEAIIFIISQKGAVGSLNSEVYPYIASKFNTIVENVERNIRNAVLQAKKNNFNNNDIYKLLNYTKMSNKVVIGYIVDRALNQLKQA